MKRFFYILVLILSVCLEASAYDVEVNGVYYNVDATKRVASVTKGTYSGSIVIADSITFRGVALEVTSIEAEAFAGCKKLEAVTIPNSVRTISNGAFMNCTNLKNVKLPDSLALIPYNCFSGCASLSSVEIPKAVEEIESNAFENCKSFGAEYVVPATVKYLGYSVWEGCNGIKTLRFEDSDQVLAPSGYYGNGANPFEWFYPTYVYVGRTVYGFYPHSSVKKVEFGANLTSWGRSNFVSDSTKIIISNIEDPSQISAPTFSDYVYKYATLYVPKGKVDIYKNADGWKPFFDIRENDGTVSGVRSVNFSTSKTVIGIYNVLGQKVHTDERGFVIIKYSDGSSKKIYRH